MINFTVWQRASEFEDCSMRINFGFALLWIGAIVRVSLTGEENVKRITVQCGIGEDRDGHPLDSQRVRDCLQAVHRYASERYGGVTAYRHVGSWVDGHGKTVTEHGVTFQAVINNAPDDDGSDFARYVRDILRQNSVVLTLETVDGRFV
jgi:uncharacterized protein YeaC (DUF1315 family)